MDKVAMAPYLISWQYCISEIILLLRDIYAGALLNTHLTELVSHALSKRIHIR